MGYEDYLALSDGDRAIVRFHLLLGLWAGEIQALALAYCLAACGVGWDPDAGGFILRGEAG